jgi:MtN3 and saliva related transmembrane protein
VREIIGWCSSFVLVLTISKQVFDQWREGRSEGVSTWLFIGQIIAGIGFAVYSWLVGNTVFLVANCLTLIRSIAGLVTLFRNRRRSRSAH